MAIDADTLRKVPFFSTFEEGELAALSGAAVVARFPAGETILREGGTGGRLFIIEDGEVEASIADDDGRHVVLSRIGPGEFFGELSAFDGGATSATITAVSPVSAVLLKQETLVQLLLDRPRMAQEVIRALVRRVRHTDGLLRRRVARDANEVIDAKETFGNRVADRVASFGGSWRFIFIFLGILVAWTAFNSLILRGDAFDPYPYILLNLFLSMVAALQAPVIMMSQNRQDAKDRIRSELDYQVNLKAEFGVSQLLGKVDALEKAVDELRSNRPGR